MREKVKLKLDLSNYATKKKLEHAAYVDTSYLAARKDFVTLKYQVGKHY